MKRTILSLIAICSTSLALQAQMPQSYTLKSCLEYGLQNNYSLRITRNEEQVSKNLLWLIRKYLKAGIMEQGKFEPTEEGSAQGSAMSPMLANIYMHHVLTLWFKLVVQREMQGECFLVKITEPFC